MLGAEDMEMHFIDTRQGGVENRLVNVEVADILESDNFKDPYLYKIFEDNLIKITL